ncbi:GNAT family N-acetyltransferase [Glaciimonas sp. PCH181]|uniref:GNAT family N-acetyltransferase n=1 Tax=Glaciimonas sp. PCH181 TaxID=2133943 RepID=UPI000D38290E|nr:GNAT family N-acetyltransferase [Glaciimonas sp. PCH181]PUA18491.1 GNAT family N-acetyltransferase [Glaciimonas sp. PCH181]
MQLKVTVDNWENLQDDAGAIRREVFVIEQKIPEELEWDEMDAVCLHAVAYDEAGQILGTGRLLPDGHIGRMAVKLAGRGQGVGGAILEALMAQARQRGDAEVVLNAQTQAEMFYQRYGFSRYGEAFQEAGIPHISMRHVFA